MPNPDSWSPLAVCLGGMRTTIRPLRCFPKGDLADPAPSAEGNQASGWFWEYQYKLFITLYF